MRLNRTILMFAAASLLVLAGCSTGSHVTLGGGHTQTGTISMVMTDTPPAGVTPLSFTVTVSSATLNAGSTMVAIPTSATPMEVTRLQTDTGFLSSDQIALGNYTSLTLTFANPSLTFENNTGAAMTVNGSVCAKNAVCTVTPSSANLTTTLTLPSTVAVTNGSSQTLVVDLNLANLFSATLSADFTAGSSVAIISPSLGQTLPIVRGCRRASDRRGHDAFHDHDSKFPRRLRRHGEFEHGVSRFPVELQVHSRHVRRRRPNRFRKYGAAIYGSAHRHRSLFQRHHFAPSPKSKASLPRSTSLARNSPWSCSMIRRPADWPAYPSAASQRSAPRAQRSLRTTWELDTTGYLFSGLADLMVGQEVSVLRNSTLSSGTSLTADRVLLRASRISTTLTVPPACPSLTISALPSFIGAAGTTQISILTSSSSANGFTEFAGTANACSAIPSHATISARGQLFSVAGGGLPTLIASKVVTH